jgi:hypothetical protein
VVFSPFPVMVSSWRQKFPCICRTRGWHLRSGWIQAASQKLTWTLGLTQGWHRTGPLETEGLKTPMLTKTPRKNCANWKWGCHGNLVLVI